MKERFMMHKNVQEQLEPINTTTIRAVTHGLSNFGGKITL